MSDALNKTVTPVDNSHSPHSSYKVLLDGSVKITNGFWAERQTLNHKVSLGHGFAMLNKAGNLHNLRMAAGLETGNYRGMNFADENVYKWLEALGWELGRSPDAELQALADEVIPLVAAAQQSDGYLDSYYQVVEPQQKWSDLDFGHELYCAGHLIQAAIAFKRGSGDERLLQIACRLVDHIETIFGPGKREGACGHPEVEMALVELFRLTGEGGYLDLAQFFVDQRGKKKMRGIGANGPQYHQDHAPIREVEGVAGHAVRQMYLASAVADLYMESGEQALLETSQRLWNDMTSGKLYITGGIGSRYDSEGFGESYELPTDQCYCETCAAIGNYFWNWRMLLMSGESRYADLMERLLFNGILSSPGVDGTSYFYVNPLMLRNGRYVRLSTNRTRNINLVVRNGTVCPAAPQCNAPVVACPVTLSPTTRPAFKFISSAIWKSLRLPEQSAAFTVATEYPWQGRVKIKIRESGDRPWKLSLRVPGWCRSFGVKVNGEDVKGSLQKGYLTLERTWQTGDIVEADLAMPAFLVEADPRLDGTRGCVAIQRGPIVYCLEEHDQAPGVNLLDVRIDTSQRLTDRWQSALLGGVMTVEGIGYQMDRSDWLANGLYRPFMPGDEERASDRKVNLTAIPYYAWGNRGLKSMRVWIPYSQGE
jgi:DUF1680 family protein